ncbi:UNVERIFIED_CONTAM: hypothetical protein Slati_2675200 [Sesamum latifolium]|uniref:Uncharacterized protein n=1 Tax=Sesamum latifolium TaxID=2727402 RepID=A0AAW2VWQ2_9LAMI
MVARLCWIEELIGRLKQPPVVGLFQQIAAFAGCSRKFEDYGEGGVATVH